MGVAAVGWANTVFCKYLAKPPVMAEGKAGDISMESFQKSGFNS
jgi:hypothetical protein